MPTPFSIFIICLNEADRIGNVLKAVEGLADEIICIDSGSTDGTQDVCRRHGARVIHNDWPGFGPQKRFGEDQCKHDWVFNLDADEVITPELRSEIEAVMHADTQPKGPFYRMRFVQVYPGDTEPRLWADYHNYVRLYDRRAGRFSTSLVDDEVDRRGGTAIQLNGIAYHFSFRDLADIAPKQRSYINLQMKEKRKNKLYAGTRMIVEYPLQFLKYYIIRRHITGGTKGIRFSNTMAKMKTVRMLEFLKN